MAKSSSQMNLYAKAYWCSVDWRKNNYEKYSHILDRGLIKVPGIALLPNIALFILVHGFKTGAFSGRELACSEVKISPYQLVLDIEIS